MTLLARRREELARETRQREPAEERRGGAVRPRPPARSFLHVQAALGNRATGGLLRAGAVLAKRRGEPTPAGSALGSGSPRGLAAAELLPLIELAGALRRGRAVPAGAPLKPRIDGLPGLIVADGAKPRPGQMERSAFLAAMRDAARQAAEEGLAGTEHTARGCPWIEHTLRFYQRQTAARIEADLLRYVLAARGAASAAELLALAAGHVRASVLHWAATGELAGVPRGLPGMGLLAALGGSLAGVGRLLRVARGNVAPSAHEEDGAGYLGEPAGRSPTAADGAGSGDGGDPGPAAAASDPAAVARQLGEGRPLDASARSRMEGALGARFGAVRLHTDSAAGRLARRFRARAFAVGRHVAFDRGEYRPGTPVGDALLAHELAHVAQQAGAARAAAAASGSPVLERDADRAAGGAVARLWAGGRSLPTRLAATPRPRLSAGLSLQRCAANSDRWFLPYRERFNALWDQEPYRSMSGAFDAELPSKGPRTQRSQEIFRRLYFEDADELREAYDENSGGLRERVDTYTGPEGLNLIDSPRLRALEGVFARFEPPIPGRAFEPFKRAVGAAAAALTQEDRDAIRTSNEWDRQINRYLPDPDRKGKILLLLRPTVAPSKKPAPAGPAKDLTQDEKVRRFFDGWDADLLFKRGLNQHGVHPTADVRYEGGGQSFQVLAYSFANPDQVVFVRVRVTRDSTVIASPAPQLFPAGKPMMPPIDVPITAPATIPAAGDALVFEVELLEGDFKTIRRSKRWEVKVRAGVVLKESDVLAIAEEDSRYLNDTKPSGFLGKMSARGGISSNVGQAIRERRLFLHALTPRHNSEEYVEEKLGKPDPEQFGFFAGLNYSRSLVSGPADAMYIPSFGSRFIAANRTPDLREPKNKRSDDALVQAVVHEAVHAFDVRPNRDSALERYKTEFRAYWMDGRFGPPLEGSCPKPPPSCTDFTAGCLGTSYCAQFAAPGPKTPRSRAIFEHLYHSQKTYSDVRQRYDKNVDGFRQAVDQYVIPDGIDLIVSLRLDDLRILISEWRRRQELRRVHARMQGPVFPEPAFPAPSPGFAGFRARVRAYVHEEGPAPPRGRLNEEEKRQVRGNRAWRDLVERSIEDSDLQRQIKQDLGIPS